MADALHRPSTRSPLLRSSGAHLGTREPGARDWRCRCCRRLLGRIRGDRLHIKLKGFTEYAASLPCTATCRTCSAINEVTRA
jgi:hypothetical protein